jgi:hypothetical protein
MGKARKKERLLGEALVHARGRSSAANIPPRAPVPPPPLQAAAPEDKPAPREVLELRADLLRRLGWAHWERQQQRRIAAAFPPAYPLF